MRSLNLDVGQGSAAQITRTSRTRFILAAVGFLLIGIAWTVRQSMLSAGAKAIKAANTAADRARIAKLESEAVDLGQRLAASPDDLALHQRMLVIFHQLRRPEQEIGQLASIVRLRPDDRAAAVALAKGRLALKQWPLAETDFRNTLKRWPTSADCWQGLSAALFHESRFREAAVAARSAVKLKPDNPSNRYVLAVALLEDVLQYPEPMLHSEELEMTRSEFEGLVKLWPTTGDIYYRLGRTYMVLKKPESAVKNLLEAQRLLPNRPDCSLYLARAYASARNSAAVRQALEAGVKQFPDSAELNDALGQQIQAGGEPGADQKALALFQNAVRIEPRSARFIERLGAAFVRTNDLRRAKESFELAASLNPNRAFPYQQLAGIYARLGDPAKSTAAAQEAAKMDANEQQFKTLQAVAKRHPENLKLRTTLADRYRYLGMRGPARDEYQAILQVDPNNRAVREGLQALENLPPGNVTAYAGGSASSTAAGP